MKIKFNNRGTTLIANIIGELDHHTAEDIRHKLDTEILKSTTRNLVFDFTNVSFMDSSGIGVVIGRYKNIQKLNGRAAIANPNSHVKRIFDMSGINSIIPVYENVDIAINNM